jgi:alpha-beta hydrolase superfamily lysophospholipase
MKKLMLHLPVYYLIFASGMYFLQDYFIYYPEKTDSNFIEKAAKNNNLRVWPGNVESYRGFVSPPAPQKVRGTIIVFHGNAGSALDRLYYVHALSRLGYRVILAEYPGYGSRPGKPGEKQFTADAVKTIRLAAKQFGHPLFLLGESLGCGVVCAAVAQSDIPIEAVGLITPWDSLLNLARDKYWFLPVRWILKDTYDNVTNLADYRGPVAVFIAGQDEIIPPRLANRLYETLRQPKYLWTFQKSGHNSWPSGPHEPWWGEMMSFLHSTASGKELKSK